MFFRNKWLAGFPMYFAPDEGGDAGNKKKDGEGDSTDDLFTEDEKDGGGSKEEKLKTVLELLAGCGIKLPDDTTSADLLDNLEGALVAYKHAKEHHGIDDGKKPEETVTPPVEEPMVGTAMSLEVESLKGRVARAEKLAAAERLKAVGFRLKGMVNAGQVSRATAKAWWDELNAKQLSLVAGDDRTISKILDQMDILEKEAPHRLNHLLTEKTKQAQQEETPAYVDFSQVVDDKGTPEPMTSDKASKILDEVYGKAK